MNKQANKDAASPVSLMRSIFSPRGFIELFVWSNLAFLTVDIYFAHSVNDFHEWTEWIPFYFSAVGSMLLLLVMIICKFDPTQGLSKVVGNIVGALSIIVGIVGMLLHLQSSLFAEFTLQKLVYSAPFVAPLSYAGIGLLIIMNRTVKADDIEWSHWTVFLALGGFLGNFVLSVLDHAQNGFFLITEWIPVIAAALAVGVLFPALWNKVSKAYLNFCIAIMLLQMGVGGLGFLLHFKADYNSGSENIFEDFVFGAPIFAPLLFANLALLGMIGLWSLHRHVGLEPTGQSTTGTNPESQPA
ncbi:hypothetical protein [Poriferisphaera sp. WC338]|uniref:hypothetical protein n=1 Tax=Poriferisphaera sp. WC338 TaxID=3425129 RepID=UPI003D81669D